MASKRTNLTGKSGAANRERLRMLLAPVMTDEYLSKLLFQAVATAEKRYSAEAEAGVNSFKEWAEDLGEMAYILMELREKAGYDGSRPKR